ncbi:YkyB family protein [Bacillus sp. 2205SS5-2]|uniref:YkyB family protein n=1 Tax=Bacillus sp. 2205SS5-2 TaxID=3109031 RepID=UPI0030071711
MTTKCEIPTYVRWGNVPEGLATKTQMKNVYGLRVHNNAEVVAYVRAYAQGRWRDFNLYKIEDGIEIKKRVVDISHIKISPSTIAEALYIINKSAKKSRDTKNHSYDSKKYSVVSRSKTRQLKLYNLKDAVINQLLELNQGEFLGYHRQVLQRENEDVTNYLKLYKLGNFTFHLPAFHSQVEGLKDLGEIGVISSDSISLDIKFHESVKLLETFIENKAI